MLSEHGLFNFGHARRDDGRRRRGGFYLYIGRSRINRLILDSIRHVDARFATTRWSVVLAAGHRTAGGRDSFASLCQSYWFPLYAYVRRRGHPPEDAQDLTQAFFTRLIEKNWVASVE